MRPMTSSRTDPQAGSRAPYLFFYPSAEGGDYRAIAPGCSISRSWCARDREVRAVYSLVMDLGSTVLHEPQSFPQYAAAVLRHLLARPVRLHARGRVSLRPRLTAVGVIRSAGKSLRASIE